MMPFLCIDLSAASRTIFHPQRSRRALGLWLTLASVAACSLEPTDSPSSSSNVSPPPSGGSTGGTDASGSGGLVDLAGGSGGSGGSMAIGTGGAAAENTGGSGTPVPSGGSGSVPVDPPILTTEITIEEDAVGFCGVDGVIESTNTGFGGAGYANTDNSLGAGVLWSFEVGEAGTYVVELTYSNGSDSDRPGEFSLDGMAVAETLPFTATTDWTTWTTASVALSLEPGVHELILGATTSEGLANLDSLRVSGAAVGAVDCIEDTGTGGISGTGGADAGTGGTNVGTGGAADLPDVTVYVAGDSTVSTYTDTASPNDQAGWGQMLHEIFDDRVTVENRARGGRTALWFHLEGETQWVLDRIQPGDYWFVQFGTNDSHPTATFVVDGVEYQRFADAQTAFKDHLFDYYVVPARDKNAIPVLVTPPPRNSAYCGNGNSLGGYAEAMRELAVAEGVLLLDLNQRTFDHLAAICPSPTPEDFFFVRADTSVDGTHFQENGARHMAGFLGDEMLDQSQGPYRYLLP